MKWIAAICIAALSAGCSEARTADCKNIAPDLLECPAPRAPRVTELKSATVVVEMTILADGRVSEARVVTLDGHPAWGDSALQAVRQWRYGPRQASRTVTVPFDFQIGG